jgi:hypothetical protein
VLREIGRQRRPSGVGQQLELDVAGDEGHQAGQQSPDPTRGQFLHRAGVDRYTHARAR